MYRLGPGIGMWLGLKFTTIRKLAQIDEAIRLDNYDELCNDNYLIKAVIWLVKN